MKTEKEKMLAGEPYDCGDTELINRWHKAKQLQKEYNDTPSDDIEKLSSSSWTTVRIYISGEMWK